MKFLAFPMFVISKIQEFWTILLYKTWSKIICLNKVSVVIHMRHTCTLGNKVT
jgi:hypothetical protein